MYVLYVIRIIGGDWKGHTLKAPSGLETRPTTAFMRGVIFNVLENALAHKAVSVLDLFAGTGSLGLEALSRGAEKAVFIESSRKAISCLQQNINEVASQKNCVVLTKNKATDWARELLKMNGFAPFDLVFCDPPYRKNLIQRSFAELEDPNLWSKDAVLVAEMDPKETVALKGWKIFKEKAHGDSKVVFLHRIAFDPPSDKA